MNVPIVILIGAVLGALDGVGIFFEPREPYKWPFTAGNLILTITHDLPATFIFPAPNRLASRRFFQRANDRATRKVVLIS